MLADTRDVSRSLSPYTCLYGKNGLADSDLSLEVKYAVVTSQSQDTRGTVLVSALYVGVMFTKHLSQLPRLINLITRRLCTASHERQLLSIRDMRMVCNVMKDM